MIWLVGVLIAVLVMLLAVIWMLMLESNATIDKPVQSNKYANLTEEQVLVLQHSYENMLHPVYFARPDHGAEAVAELSLLNARLAELKREREDAEMVARYLPEIEEGG